LYLYSEFFWKNAKAYASLNWLAGFPAEEKKPFAGGDVKSFCGVDVLHYFNPQRGMHK